MFEMFNVLLGCLCGNSVEHIYSINIRNTLTGIKFSSKTASTSAGQSQVSPWKGIGQPLLLQYLHYSPWSQTTSQAYL